MNITFLTSPSLGNNKPAERTFRCTRMVYMASTYELIVVAILEQYWHDFWKHKRF